MIEMDPLFKTFFMYQMMDNTQYYTHIINQPLPQTFKESPGMLLKEAEKLCSGETRSSMEIVIILWSDQLWKGHTF
jgi:hypothetical protein